MEEVFLCGLVIIFLDVIFYTVFWIGLVLLKCSNCGLLTKLWTFEVVKWLFLHIFTSLIIDGKSRAVLHRFVGLLCLLSPVFETGQILMRLPSEPHMESASDPGMLLLVILSSSIACMVWERNWKMKKESDKLDSKRLLMRTLTFFKADTLHLIVAFSFLILGVFCDSYIPLYQGKFIDILRGKEDQSSQISVGGALVLFSLGSALFTGLRGGVFKNTLDRLNKRLKHQLFYNLLQQEVYFFEENNPGRLASRLHSDVDRMGRTVALNANVVVRSSVKTLLMLRVMLGLSWKLTMLTCIEMPLLAVIQNKYASLTKDLKDQTQECHAHTKDLASQTISGIQTVRSFSAEGGEIRRYKEALDQLAAIRRRLGIYSATFCFVRRVVGLGIKLAMLILARSLISSDQLTIGTLVAFLLYQKPMTTNLREIMYCYGETVSTVGVISKVLGYLDRKPKHQKEGNLSPEKLDGRIVFQNVTFSYASAPDKPALKSVTMELKPGKITALVGPSGSGKTSCVSLLKRLYEPQLGQILLDGEPLHHYRHKYLQQKVALVSQNPVLFSGSLRYNIGYGLKDCPMDKVEEVSRRINAHGFISEMEDGYDTDVGERGGKLSEGHKQSVAVIRALVRDPQVIILDEATSKLDVSAQYDVLQEVLACGRTVLVVAHQLSTVEKADHIIFMEHGSVAEEGTHKELMAKEGRYYCFKEQLFHGNR